MQITEAIRLQMKVQRRLQEQLEVMAMAHSTLQCRSHETSSYKHLLDLQQVNIEIALSSYHS